MSQVVTFKCPCCGGYLEFDASKQRFKCLYCGQLLSEEDLRDQSAQREAEADAVQTETAAEQGEHSIPDGHQEGLRTYNCSMCGAEIVTTETTAATRCYFCHSPVVLHDRLDDEFRPDGVIPFQLDKEAAKKKFMEFVSKKKFIDRSFFSDDQLEMFSGVYYPYWYCDIEGVADFEGEGKHTSVASTMTHIVTTTKIYQVTRRANLVFRNLARKALSKVDGKLSDGIHPFDITGVKPYASGYLSGFLAEKRDIEQNTVTDSMVEEVRGYAGRLMQQNHSFNSLSGKTAFSTRKVDSRYVLLPVWVLTYKGGKDGAQYYYLMNGQTGKVCGKLPVDKGRLWSTALMVGGAVFAILCAGGAFIW